jgi:hypothetical protein
MFRQAIISEAINLVGNRADIRDYQCSCHPGGERFLVTWQDAKYPACYNLDELKAELKKVLTGQNP